MIALLLPLGVSLLSRLWLYQLLQRPSQKEGMSDLICYLSLSSIMEAVETFKKIIAVPLSLHSLKQ